MAKIVVIEDNPTNMKLITFLLHGVAHEVIPATDAEIGLPLVRQHLPALVLMDLQLPGMDGITAIRQLKADIYTAPIPIIALTAEAMNGVAAKVLAAGGDGYLPKPLHHREFLALVEKMLAKNG